MKFVTATKGCHSRAQSVTGGGLAIRPPRPPRPATRNVYYAAFSSAALRRGMWHTWRAVRRVVSQRAEVVPVITAAGRRSDGSAGQILRPGRGRLG